MLKSSMQPSAESAESRCWKSDDWPQPYSLPLSLSIVKNKACRKSRVGRVDTRYEREFARSCGCGQAFALPQISFLFPACFTIKTYTSSQAVLLPNTSQQSVDNIVANETKRLWLPSLCSELYAIMVMMSMRHKLSSWSWFNIGLTMLILQHSLLRLYWYYWAAWLHEFFSQRHLNFWW